MKQTAAAEFDPHWKLLLVRSAAEFDGLFSGLLFFLELGSTVDPDWIVGSSQFLDRDQISDRSRFCVFTSF